MQNFNNDNDLPSESKLQWACRRGMLELDVLLGNFLQEAYPQLSLADKKTFAILLTYTDPELFSWLIDQAQAADARLARMVAMIRQHAHDRHQA